MAFYQELINYSGGVGIESRKDPNWVLERLALKDFLKTCLGPKHVRKWPRTYCKTIPHGEWRKSFPTTSCPPRCGLDTRWLAEEMPGFLLLGWPSASVLYRKTWREALVSPWESWEKDKSPLLPWPGHQEIMLKEFPVQLFSWPSGQLTQQQEFISSEKGTATLSIIVKQ